VERRHFVAVHESHLLFTEGASRNDKSTLKADKVQWRKWPTTTLGHVRRFRAAIAALLYAMRHQTCYLGPLSSSCGSGE
jgi:hypothetical protein